MRPEVVRARGRSKGDVQPPPDEDIENQPPPRREPERPDVPVEEPRRPQPREDPPRPGGPHPSREPVDPAVAPGAAP